PGPDHLLPVSPAGQSRLVSRRRAVDRGPARRRPPDHLGLVRLEQRAVGLAHEHRTRPGPGLARLHALVRALIDAYEMVFDSRAWVLLVLPLLGCASEVLPAGSAIVDGDVAEDLTGVVALLDDTGEAFCSGVAIADDHVLTAAHCVEGWEPGELRVRVDHGPGDSTVVAILTVLVDPAFDPAS